MRDVPSGVLPSWVFLVYSCLGVADVCLMYSEGLRGSAGWSLRFCINLRVLHFLHIKHTKDQMAWKLLHHKAR